MIKIKWNWACLKVCGEEGKGQNCLQKWNRQRETRAEKSYCSRRLPPQRLPLHIRATHLCPHFKVVVVGLVFLAAVTWVPHLLWGLGEGRFFIWVGRWELEREKFLSLRCLLFPQPFLFRHATSAWKARALRDETNQCCCVGDNLCRFDCIVYWQDLSRPCGLVEIYRVFTAKFEIILSSQTTGCGEILQFAFVYCTWKNIEIKKW